MCNKTLANRAVNNAVYDMQLARQIIYTDLYHESQVMTPITIDMHHVWRMRLVNSAVQCSAMLVGFSPLLALVVGSI